MTIKERKQNKEYIHSSYKQKEIIYFDGIMTHTAVITSCKYGNEENADIMFLPESINYMMHIDARNYNNEVEPFVIFEAEYNGDKMEAIIQFFIEKGLYKFEEWDID
jgi:hypothetical protein